MASHSHAARYPTSQKKNSNYIVLPKKETDPSIRHSFPIPNDETTSTPQQRRATTSPFHTCIHTYTHTRIIRTFTFYYIYTRERVRVCFNSAGTINPLSPTRACAHRMSRICQTLGRELCVLGMLLLRVCTLSEKKFAHGGRFMCSR